jgi:DNA-directed RNA polymerase beta' subunit
MQDLKDKLVIKDFSKFGKLISQPNLNSIQIDSYKWFLEKGLRELLDEISPILDHAGKEFELYFEEYRFDEPKFDEITARYKDDIYAAPLYINVKLVNKKTGKSEKQEIYFGEIPKMTDRGTFIINGVERIVVSQLVRSAGVSFNSNISKGKQFFGAKVIPGKGVWLEFETDNDGVIGVKIDKHRKVPVTDLLRIFLAKDEDQNVSDEKIKSFFKDIDNGEVKYIEKTFEKDAASNLDEAYLEVYKRLRPGDPATAHTARNLIDSIFKRKDRYDLSRVGRYKFNQRLNISKNKTSGLLDFEDLVLIVREIIKLNNDPNALPDDIDHLGNRRIKAVGELLSERLRIGFARLRRIIQDRMSTLPQEEILPSHLINFRPLISSVNEFFLLSQLSQFGDQINPLSELEHKRRLSALGPGGLNRERAGYEVRDVHHSHYGRICPIETPEGHNIGLINYLASFSRLNEFGFLETPYAKVKNGKVTDEIIWLDALEEEKYKIVESTTPRDKNNKLIGSNVNARFGKEIITCKVEEVDLSDVAPNQFISVSTSLIPFLQHDDANRALMGSNMQRQAVPLIKPQVPLVGTGEEEKIARDSGYLILAEDDGEVLEADANHIKVKYKNGKIVNYSLLKFRRSNQFTSISQTLKVLPKTKIKKGDVLADGPAMDSGALALGQNLLVAFMPFEGLNFEDAIVISERVVRDDLFTSIHIEEFYCDVRDTKLGPEITTPDIPNVSEEKLRNLDEEGIIRIGAEVNSGDILVGKISPKGEVDLTPEERLLRAIFGEKARDVKDTSLVVPHGKRGRVIGIKIFSRDRGDKLEAGIIKRIVIEIAALKKVQAGDKLAGRHGNKGVISIVKPVEDMPYLADGTPVDIVLNPLGVASRMNLGQILETHLGWAAHQLGYRAITPGLDSVKEEEISEELEKAGLPKNGKITLFDGRTGEPFYQPVTVGYIYMMKLNHLVEDKVHMRSIGPYSLITQQPLGGKAQFGGQRFGEMEVWALEGYGAKNILQEMLTIKSDDVLGRSSAYEAIIRGEKIKKPNIPASFNVLMNEIKALGLNIEPLYDSNSRDKEDFKALKISIASPDDILSWSYGEVLKPETINYRTQRPEKDGLFSERIFGPIRDYECACGKYKKVKYKGIVCDKCGVEVTRSYVRRERMGHIKLAVPVSHIWFLRSIPSRLALVLNTSSSKLESVIYYIDYIVTEIDEEKKNEVLNEIDAELKNKLKSIDPKNKELKLELTNEASRLKQILTSLHPGYILSENEYFDLSRRFGGVFKAGTGAEAVREILEKIDLKKEIRLIEKQIEESKDPLSEVKNLRRLKIFRSMLKNNIRPEWMILTVLPVLPPDLRPMVALDGGRFATSDLNDLYRRVINRNNRLKKLLEIKAPEIIIKNEKRMLQEAVDALIDNSSRSGNQQMSSRRRPLRSLTDMLKGKQGRFRQNLLGKRVDYSGRSVIVVGPKLKISECGLPKKMALELFKPFVIGELIKRGLAFNVRSANRLIEQETEEIWSILEEIVRGKRVLLNRAPTLHRLSVQAFKPILIEGLAIQIPPLVCSAFNADFDGDQMAVHLPLSDEAQKEAEEIMAAEKNILKPATGDLITTPTQDFVLGVYYLTSDPIELEPIKYFATKNEALFAYFAGYIKINNLIGISGIKTTIGRIIFNEILEGLVPFVNEVLNKKKLSKLIENISENFGAEKTSEIIDKLKLLGFEYATLSGITWSIYDLIIPKEKKEILAQAGKEINEVQKQYESGFLTEAERKLKVISIWQNAQSKISKLVKEVLPKNNPIFMIIDSGSRGSWSQPIQMFGMKGLVSNPKNETIEMPIKSSYKEGLDVLEYFISTHGARKGTTDTALKTAQAGYLTRRLVDVSQDVLIREEDCGTKDGIIIYKKDCEDAGVTFESRIFGRVTLEDIKIGKDLIVKSGEIINKKSAELIAKSNISSIKVRSPITCKTLYGICSSCYGYDLGYNRKVEIGQAVGVVAAQSIGEPGTQLTMRTFHIGGVAGVDITHGLPRVEELFEVRSPKGKGIVVESNGKVIAIEEHGNQKKIIIELEDNSKKKSKKTIEYIVPSQVILFVNVGDKVLKGDLISEGNFDLRELLKYKNEEEVIRYLLNEIQKIYAAEGSPVHSKHIEIIIRQMFSRVRIIDPGDSTDFVLGEMVSKSRFLEVNRELKKEGKKLAHAEQLILGISKVASSTESFLSAASFQDTARVLVKAAIEGSVDYLRGLKENVIVGRLLPSGELEQIKTENLKRLIKGKK